MNSSCTTPWESKNIINMVLMWDLRNFSFFGQGDISPTHSELCRFVLGSQAKHQVSSPVLILLKKVLSAFAIMIMSWQYDSIFPLLRCQGVRSKMYTQLSLSQILFQNPELQSWGCSKILLSFLMRFDSHFWPNQQQQQCLHQFKSIMNGHLSYHLPAPFCLEIHNTI